ncbi:DUF397 domain-containing protein [Streptomyces sp. 4N509B]|uniref:DUF397 domain-containing protein n=1 Tax=Streptomyces sp. 4N509B TaxID=3457413 RepID=UPI003FD462A2
MTTHVPTHHGVPFRTSTMSNDDCVAVAAAFTTSSYSINDCVAVAAVPPVVAVADTKTGHAPVVEVAPAAWKTFVAHLRQD